MDGLIVGCGEFRHAGWLHIDVHADDRVRPDVVASVLDLPFADDSFDRVYMGHVLEHLERDDVTVALAEVGRVLRPGGELMIVGPDLDRAVGQFADVAPSIRTGGGRWPGDRHLWDSTETETLRLVRLVFPDAQPLPVSDVPGLWPVVSKVGWQFAVHVRR